jgi:hypothetical protein
MRDEALMEKEKELASIRTETHTLDNYKYVLDHKVETMATERGTFACRAGASFVLE